MAGLLPPPRRNKFHGVSDVLVGGLLKSFHVKFGDFPAQLSLQLKSEQASSRLVVLGCRTKSERERIGRSV
jgi:hypothetical protein